MNKLFYYELRRILWNKLFFILVGSVFFYGWLLLSSDVILGIADTAPFSSWSSGYYLSRLTPIFCLAEVLFLVFYSSRNEEMVQLITKRTVFSQRSYFYIRCGVMFLAQLLLCFTAMVEGIVFCGVFFHKYPFISYLLPFVATVLPMLLFCLGTGSFLVGCQKRFLAILVLILAVGYLHRIDLFGEKFFTTYPLKTGILDPSFQMPFWLSVKESILSAIGILFFSLEAAKR